MGSRAWIGLSWQQGVEVALTFKKLPTIEEWLALKDWSFSPNVTEGTQGDYYWVRCEGAFFVKQLSQHVLPKKPFRVLVTYWDGAGGGPNCYGGDSGWSQLGSNAISDSVMQLPELNFDADTAVMLIDTEYSDSELSQMLVGFEEFQPYLAETDKFWHVIDRLQPYCYFSYLDEGIFVARGKDLYQSVFNAKYVEALIGNFRQREHEYRRRTWDELGPECGPERCVESGCERLRISLAVRCLLHQLMGGWKTQTL